MTICTLILRLWRLIVALSLRLCRRMMWEWIRRRCIVVHEVFV